MKSASLTPYQAIQAFIAILNPTVRKYVVENDVMLMNLINGYVDGLVETERITRHAAASAVLNARWMAGSILDEMESNNAEAHA